MEGVLAAWGSLEICVGGGAEGDMEAPMTLFAGCCFYLFLSFSVAVYVGSQHYGSCGFLMWVLVARLVRSLFGRCRAAIRSLFFDLNLVLSSG